MRGLVVVVVVDPVTCFCLVRGLGEVWFMRNCYDEVCV